MGRGNGSRGGNGGNQGGNIPGNTQPPGNSQPPAGDYLTSPPGTMLTSKPPELNPPPEAVEDEIVWIEVKIPISRAELTRPGFCSGRIDVDLQKNHAQVFRALRYSLDRIDAKTERGRPVKASTSNSIRWLFDKIAAAIEEQLKPENPSSGKRG